MDAKTQVLELPYLVCRTGDNEKVHLTPVLYYRISNAVKATFQVSSLRHALEQHIQTKIQENLRQKRKLELIECPDELPREIREAVNNLAEGWGVEIEEILIKDFGFDEKLPTNDRHNDDGVTAMEIQEMTVTASLMSN